MQLRERRVFCGFLVMSAASTVLNLTENVLRGSVVKQSRVGLEVLIAFWSNGQGSFSVWFMEVWSF